MNIPPMRKRTPKLASRNIVAYDLESTRIQEGTPEPLFLTMFDGENTEVYETIGYDALHDVVVSRMLTDERAGCRFVAYNGNRFDAYLIARSLMSDSRFRCEPWLTKGKSMRGMLIRSTENKRRMWHFSDPMAMFAFLGKLDDFLRVYAPEYHKHHIDVENFDTRNIEHIEYAINDSVACWHATINASEILEKVTGIPAQNTIGKVAVKYFESKMPEDTLVWKAPTSMQEPLRKTKRGGYVHCAGRFRGRVWKYDINQAYAWAMKQPMPSGRAAHTAIYLPEKLGIYRVTISRDEPTLVPFYCRGIEKGVHWTDGYEVETWILSTEVEFLIRTGWNVRTHEGWVWSDRFDMSEMVDHLEHERLTCEGGPKGAIGTMIKYVGNNAFGKTIEEHDGLRMVFSAEKPDGYHYYQAEDEDFDGVWFKYEEPKEESYHKPQIGCFIMAYARIRIMETALFAPKSFLYADTDCIVFTKNMDHVLWLDVGKYGAFKIEESGTPYIFINKKVYCSETLDDDGIRPKTAHAKGLNVNKLTYQEYIEWYNGVIPEQEQVQRQSIVKTMAKSPMFLTRERDGSFVLPLADVDT